jgi:phosphatidylglycerol:prolipoprotein diacylglycerol transferase
MAQQKQQRGHQPPARPAAGSARGGGPKGLPKDALAELLELAAERAAVRPGGRVHAGPTPADAPKPAARIAPAPAPAPPIDVPPLARLAGSPEQTSRLEFVTTPFRVLADLEPQTVAVSYWMEVPAQSDTSRVDVKFTGRRLEVAGPRTPADDFVVAATVAEVAAGSGPTAVTQRIAGVAPGLWSVTADAYATPLGADRAAAVRLPSVQAKGRSVPALIAQTRAPGVVIGAWPTMVALGFALGLALQGFLARTHGLSSGRVLVLAIAAGLLGLLGAKTYYHLTHLREARGPWLAGLSVQGFVIVATSVFVLGGWAWGVPIGHLLDATIPALLVGQALGRLGCLLAGCCSGRPTTRHWAIWSSDRTVGTRRIPVQVLESSSAGLLAVVTGLIAWRTPPEHAGFLFLAGLAAYVLVRQILFPLRGLPRATRYGRAVMLVVAPAVLVGAIVGSAIA